MGAQVATGALARAQQIYETRADRARELHKQGKKVIGYYCCFIPEEFLDAAGFLPYRLMGDIHEPITRADIGVEVNLCPYIRSTVDNAMKANLDFLDGLVCPHSCDAIQRIYRLWKYYVPDLQFTHYLDVPHVLFDSSRNFYREELEFFKEKLQVWSGHELTDETLSKYIKLHNEKRRLIREIYELRKPDPPLIAGREVTELLVAGMSVPVEEFNQLLRDVLEEVKNRTNRPEKKNIRLMIWGSELDHSEFIKLIEECGAHVVMDDLCIGTRHFWNPVDESKKPMDALVEKYWDLVTCPRLYRGPGVERFQHLLDYARDFNVNGVILYTMRYCDSHELDVPDLRDHLQDNGYPVIHLEDDYSMASIGQFRTRLQAFMEMIS